MIPLAENISTSVGSLAAYHDKNTSGISSMLLKCIVIMVDTYKNPKLNIVMFS
jgi:hypothetical protein